MEGDAGMSVVQRGERMDLGTGVVLRVIVEPVISVSFSIVFNFHEMAFIPHIHLPERAVLFMLTVRW